MEVFDYPNRQNNPTKFHTNQGAGSGTNCRTKPGPAVVDYACPFVTGARTDARVRLIAAGQIEPADGGCFVPPERYAAMPGLGQIRSACSGSTHAVVGAAIKAARGHHRPARRAMVAGGKRAAEVFLSPYCLQRLVKRDYIRCCMLTFFYLQGVECWFAASRQVAAARINRSRTPSHSAASGRFSTQISLTPCASKSRSTANSCCAVASASSGMRR